MGKPWLNRNYWRDYDTALFILKHLYQDIPEDLNSPVESNGGSSKDQNVSTGLSDQRETTDEELPLTFSDRIMTVVKIAGKLYFDPEVYRWLTSLNSCSRSHNGCADLHEEDDKDNIPCRKLLWLVSDESNEAMAAMEERSGKHVHGFSKFDPSIGQRVLLPSVEQRKEKTSDMMDNDCGDRLCRQNMKKKPVGEKGAINENGNLQQNVGFGNEIDGLT
ncbi:hypothetical protein QQP08_023593 [Theobroma cacao]|nr:hypothetical protein QQP08_023593 [Theobroma cacao]